MMDEFFYERQGVRADSVGQARLAHFVASHLKGATLIRVAPPDVNGCVQRFRHAVEAEQGQIEILKESLPGESGVVCMAVSRAELDACRHRRGSDAEGVSQGALKC